MQRRAFLLAPVALASLWGCAQSGTPSQSNVGPSARVPVTLSRQSAGGRALVRNVGNLVPGDVSIEVDLWLRLDVDAPPAGGVLIRPSFRIIEDSYSGRRPLLSSDQLQGKSPPNSNEVHLTGKASGVSHDDVLRPLWLEVAIVQAVAFGSGAQSTATVSTVPGKESYVIVSCG